MPTTAPSSCSVSSSLSAFGQQVGHRDGGQVEGGVVPAHALLDQEAVEAPDARERPGHRRRTVGPAQCGQVGRHVGGRRLVDAVAFEALLVGPEVAPVGRQGAGRAPALDLEPGEVLLGVPGQRLAHGTPPAGAAQALAGQVQAEHRRLVLERPVAPPGRRRRRGGSSRPSCSPPPRRRAGPGMAVRPVAR